MISSKVIDNLVLSGSWHIDEQYGISELSNLMLNLESNISPKELLAQREEKSAINYLSLSGNPTDLSDGSTDKGRIALLNLDGVMRVNDGLCNQGIKSLSNNLRSLYADESVKGIIIEANTGGGESLSGNLLQATIADKNKPVGVYARMLASAGVMGTLGSDFIIAEGKGSKIGSIGSYLSIDKELAEYLKTSKDDIYAEGSENKNKGIRDYLKGDKASLQKEVTKNAQIFRDAVQEARPNVDAEVLKGGMYYAEEALEKGLIDGVGTLNTAIAKINSIINTDKQPVNMSNYTGLVSKLASKFGITLNSDATLEEIESAIDTANVVSEESFEAFKKESNAALEAKVTSLTENFQSMLEGYVKSESLSEIKEELNNVKESVGSVSTEVQKVAEDVVGSESIADNVRDESSSFEATSKILDAADFSFEYEYKPKH